MSKRTDDDYLRTTWWEDRDVEIRRHRLKMVTTRKPHRCAGNEAGEEHEIPAGARALYESAIMDDEVVSCWLCTDCMDAWLDVIEPLEPEDSR